MRQLREWGPGTACVLLVLASWEGSVRLGWLDAALLPPFSAVLQSLAGIVRGGAFAAPLLRTVALMAAGFALAATLGIALGLWMGRSEAAFRMFEPLVELLRPIPKPALVPPLFLFLGIGLGSMLFIVVLAAFFPVLINTIQGVRGIDPVLVGTARTLRLSRCATLLRIVLPAALPMVMTGLRVSLGLALTLVVVAEMMAGENGVGFLVLDMQRAFQIRQMYAWLLVLAALGVALNTLFEWCDRRLLPWRAHQ